MAMPPISLSGSGGTQATGPLTNDSGGVFIVQTGDAATSGTGTAFNWKTLLIVAAVAAAVWYFYRRAKA